MDEDRDQPLWQQDFGKRAPPPTSGGSLRKLRFVFVGIAFCLCIRLIEIEGVPFSMRESLLLVLLLALPFSVLAYRSLRPIFFELGVGEKNEGGDTNSLITSSKRDTFLYLFLIFIVYFFLVWAFFQANSVFDTSSAETKSFTVIATEEGANGLGQPRYYAYVPVPDFVDLPFHFTDRERIEISMSESRRIVVGVSQITLFVHHGALGIPWYETAYSLEGLAERMPDSEIILHDGATIPPLIQDEKLKEACLWKKNFNFSSEIEAIAPDDYIRDYWAGGEPRSVEPVVKGERHGLGHYTFANGQVYADIPWKHGKKHGVFTLYREDGTREQVLSYKEGEPYGINLWYKADGQTLADSTVFVGASRVVHFLADIPLGGETQPLSACEAYGGGE